LGRPKEPEKVKLIIGVIACSRDAIASSLPLLEESFGSHDLESSLMSFDFTDYYEEEMGSNLLRKFFAFARLVHQEDLVEIKHLTQGIEEKISLSGAFRVKRPVNLDPGFISASKLVLASTKDSSHRLYLGRGIFGEVTLRFHRGKFEPLPWTYPDYRTGPYITFFEKVRSVYLRQLRSESTKER